MILANRIKKDEPILFYYSPIKNDNEIIYIDTVLALNDKNIGVLLPEQYKAVAEKSKRIEELNEFSLNRVLNEIDVFPDKIFIIALSVRLLEEPKVNRLLKKIQGKESSFIFAFDKLRLNETFRKSAKGLLQLKRAGVKIMIDGMENAAISSLLDLDCDFIRLDARYFDEKECKHLLKALSLYAHDKNIILTAKNIDTDNRIDIFQKQGIKLLQGKVICKPKRYLGRMINSTTES